MNVFELGKQILKAQTPEEIVDRLTPENIK